MTTVETVTGDRRGMQDFLALPYALYRDDPLWVPPLRHRMRHKFDPRHGPFLQGATADFFVAYRAGRPVGRVTAHLDARYNAFHQVRHGFFGFYESDADPETARVLIQAVDAHLRRLECSRVLGPFNFSINDECGFQVAGFERRPVIMMPRTKPYYPDLFASMGYQVAQTLTSYVMDQVAETPALVTRLAERVRRRETAVDIRTLAPGHRVADLETILGIYNEAWSGNWGYSPMSACEMAGLARELRRFADPRFVYTLFKGGEPAACLVALPDLNQLLVRERNGRISLRLLCNLLFARQRINCLRITLLGVRPSFRSLGLDVLLYERCFRDGLNTGRYRHTEMGWILDCNEKMSSVPARIGALPINRYVILEKELTDGR